MTDSYGESMMLRLEAAALLAGRMGYKHRDDPSHPELRAAEAELSRIEEMATSWAQAVDKILEHEVAYRPAFCRPGDPSRVKVEDTPAGGAQGLGGLRGEGMVDNTATVSGIQGKNGTTSQGASHGA